MRVALIGNMNNNHFAMMRYLRDLGIDAHLWMYTNEADHFHPRCDTWDWPKWEPFVRTLPLSNGGVDAVLKPRAELELVFKGFDVYVGNGIAPVLFARMGRTLDVFIPYGEGVEFIIEHHFNWKHPRSSLLGGIRKRLMERALVNSVETIITANVHPHSQETYRRLGLLPMSLSIPLLYLESRPPDRPLPSTLLSAIARMQASSLVVFSHVAHAWKNLPVPHYGGGVGKRNQWLVEGFARYIKRTGNRDALLCLVEYGRDVPASKELVESLGIAAQVVWLPQMERREILSLLPHVDLGGSEFSEMLWGSTGWEFLASGVPMLHQLKNPEKYESLGGALPPFFNVDSPEEIAAVLAGADRASLRRMGEACRRWFQDHHGERLAHRYLALFERIADRSGQSSSLVKS